MNLGHNNSSQRSFMGDDMMAMKRCRYISSTEKELFVGTGTTCLVLYSSETHRIQVLHDIEAVYPRAHTMDIDPGNWNCDSFLNELSLRRILMFMIVDAAVILILMCRNIVNVAIQIAQLL